MIQIISISITLHAQAHVHTMCILALAKHRCQELQVAGWQCKAELQASPQGSLAQAWLQGFNNSRIELSWEAIVVSTNDPRSAPVRRDAESHFSWRETWKGDFLTLWRDSHWQLISWYQSTLSWHLPGPGPGPGLRRRWRPAGGGWWCSSWHRHTMYNCNDCQWYWISSSAWR